MTSAHVPRWIRLTSAALGCATLVLGGLCFFAPELLFGLDAYHTLTRVPIGFLGATACGLGIAAVVAAAEADTAVLRSVVLSMLIASALIPPVIIYNVGAFDQVDTSGARAFALSGGVIMMVSLPLLLSLLVLNRLHHMGQSGSAAADATSSQHRAVDS
jgi:hypothetical protein